MSKKDVKLSSLQIAGRLMSANPFEKSYKNPFLLGYLYYTEGLSTLEIADLLGCHDRTIRRYMNYHGFKRFSKRFALLVEAHGVEKALEMSPPEFYPLGVHND